MAVGFDGDGAVLIGPVDGGAEIAIAVQNGRRRVAEGVAAAGADDGDVGTQGAAETPSSSTWRCRDAGPSECESATRANDGAIVVLDLPADVAREDERHAAVAISSTSESSLRTRCRSQSGGGWMVNGDRHVAKADDDRRAAASATRRRRLSASAAASVVGSCGGTGTPSQTSRG